MINNLLFNVENIIILPSSIIHFMGPLNKIKYPYIVIFSPFSKMFVKLHVSIKIEHPNYVNIGEHI